MARYYIPTDEDCIAAGFTDGTAETHSASAELLERAGLETAAAKRADLESERLRRYDRLYYALTPDRAAAFFRGTDLGGKWDIKARFPLRSYNPADGSVIVPVAERIASVRECNGGDFDDKMLEIKKYTRKRGKERWEEWALIATIRSSSGTEYKYLIVYWVGVNDVVVELPRFQHDELVVRKESVSSSTDVAETSMDSRVVWCLWSCVIAYIVLLLLAVLPEIIVSLPSTALVP